MMLGQVVAAEPETVVGLDHVQARFVGVTQRLTVGVEVVEDTEFHICLAVF